jgi:hypothetical protein
MKKYAGRRLSGGPAFFLETVMRPVSRTWIVSLMILLFVVLMLQSTVGMSFTDPSSRQTGNEGVQRSVVPVDHLIRVDQPRSGFFGRQVGI